MKITESRKNYHSRILGYKFALADFHTDISLIYSYRRYGPSDVVRDGGGADQPDQAGGGQPGRAVRAGEEEGGGDGRHAEGGGGGGGEEKEAAQEQQKDKYSETETLKVHLRIGLLFLFVVV